MKRIKFISIVLLSITLASCGPTIYKASNFDENKENVRKLAILPFEVTIDMKRLPKGVTPESIKNSEEKTGYKIQDNAYTWFLKREKDYSVGFQDISKTNSLLKHSNITYEMIASEDKSELCKLLGVDAVISGKAAMARPMSDGAAVALGVLFGAWGNTNNVNTSIVIHDTKGDLLWKYDYNASGSVGSNTTSLTDALMRNASRKFPYKSK